MNRSLRFLLGKVFPVLILLVGLIYVFVPEQEFKDTKERFEFTSKFLEGVEAAESYAEMLSHDSTNTKLHYAFVKAWFKANKKKRTFLKDDLKRRGIYPEDIFKSMVSSSDTASRNPGYFGLACIEYFADRPVTAMTLLDSTEGQKIPGKELLYGRIHIKLNNNQEACEHFNNEITQGAQISDVWKFAINCVDDLSVSKLLQVREEYGDDVISDRFVSVAQLMNGSLLGYLTSVFGEFLNNFHFPGVLLALLALVIWGIYIMKLTALTHLTKWVQVIAILSGIGCVIFVYLIGDQMHYTFGLRYPKTLLGTFFRAVFDIGFIEEFSKLIPVFILTILFRPCRISPVWLIGLATLSGLGFTFSEDSQYFDSKSLDIITSRSILTGCLHMAWSSIAVYGYVEYRFRESKNGKFWLIPMYFMLAVTLHGLYDFCLMEPTFHKLRFISLLIALISIIWWVSMLTNALNNSNAYPNRFSLNIGKLNNLLLILFCSIVILEYLTNAAIYGAQHGFNVLTNGFQSALFAIPILAYCLSRIDIAPGGWNGLNDIIYRHIQDPQLLFQRKFKIEAYRELIENSVSFPLVGRISERLCYKGDNNWYLFVRTNTPDKPEGEVESILIKAKSRSKNLLDNKSLVYVRKLAASPDESINLERASKPSKFIGWGVLKPI